MKSPLDQKQQWEAILDHNRHEEILGRGTHEVKAWGEMAQMRLFFGEAWGGGDYLRAISVLRAPSGCPAGTLECPLLPNSVVSVAQEFSTFLTVRFSLHNQFYSSVVTKKTSHEFNRGGKHQLDKTWNSKSIRLVKKMILQFFMKEGIPLAFCRRFSYFKQLTLGSV